MTSSTLSTKFMVEIILNRSLLLTLLFFLTIPISAQESTGVSFWVAADSLQVREEPTNSNDIKDVGILTLGTKVSATHFFDSWVQITKPLKGWIFGPALVASESKLNERIAGKQIMKTITQHNIWLKQGDNDISHLLWWISGNFPATIKMGVVQIPEPKLNQGAYIRYLADEVPKGMPLLGKSAMMEMDDIFIFTNDGWQKIGKWMPSNFDLSELKSEDVNTGKSIQGMTFSEPLPAKN